MRRLLFGVIGHVDHGKTALVRALTGMETDRLAEEQRRGISIALGFAHLTAGDAAIDLVDMPGHERFVRTMISGATGLDAVLLVVAANEGIKPQTVEHVGIVGLLGVRQAVVAVTKADLVAPAEAAAVGEDARALLRRAGLEAPEAVPCAAPQGRGLDALRTSLAAVERAGRPDRGFFYLPMDRAFSVPGHGTVATGTLRHGVLKPGTEVAIVPGDRVARVRALQVHGHSVQAAEPGARVAANLRGIEAGQAGRGLALAPPGLLQPARWLTAALRLVTDAGEGIGGGERLRLLFGTAEVEARLRLLDRDVLEEDGVVAAQLHCAEPVAVPARESFVLRAVSPPRTLGGGIILDPAAHRLRRNVPEINARLLRLANETGEQTLRRELAEAGERGRLLLPLARIAGLSPSRAAELLKAAAGPNAVLLGAGEVAVRRDALERATARILALLGEVHPASLSAEQLLARLPELSPAVLEMALGPLAGRNAVRREGGGVRLLRDEHERDVLQQDAALRQEIEAMLRAGGLTPPDLRSVLALHPAAKRGLDRLLREGTAIKATDRVQKRDLVFHCDAVAAAQRALAPQLAPPGLLVAEIGALLGISRKYSVPLLEYLDAIKYTQRVEDRRVLAAAGD